MSDETKTVTYTVQREVETTVKTGDLTSTGLMAWIDIATVKVPAQSKRATIIKAGLKEAGVAPTPGETLRLRVLDTWSQTIAEAKAETPEPEWTL